MISMEKVLAALLSSDSQAEAAQKCGITPKTLRKYLADESFKREYQYRRQLLVSDATRQMQSSFQLAINALRGIVSNESSSESAKISAARSILEYGLRFSEINDVMTRLEALERTIDK